MNNDKFSMIKDEEEYRKLSYMFPEYLFLDRDFSICLAGRGIEELLNYNYGFLRNKSINFLSDEGDLKSSIMIQMAENFFEWRSYLLKAGNMVSVEAEICGFKATKLEYAISPIVIHIRRSREHLEKNSTPAVDDLTYWIAHNLRAPLATLEGLINLAKIQNNTAEMEMYLAYMSQNAESLDDKIRMMVRLTSRSV
jgi:nitrogen-specific signal transduction histidine kinase